MAEITLSAINMYKKAKENTVMKKIRMILVGTLVLCALGLLTACNNTGNKNNTGNGSGTITTTAAGKDGVMDDIKEGAENIATDMGIDGDNNNATSTTR